MKTHLKLSLFCLAILSASALANAQTTAFTYNGRLNNNGVPVTGLYDLQFTIFDSSGGSGIVATPPPMNSLGITNGLFTVRLDPGAGVFTGPARWLELRVRPSGGGAFQTLSPRQELTSSPYSIHAQTAGSATDVANGSVVKSLNTLKDNVTLVAGANVTISPSGNTLTIASAGGAGGGTWSSNGTSTYYNRGNVGIGTASPLSALHISGVSDGLRLTGSRPFLTLDDTSAGLYSRIQANGAGMDFKTEGAVTGSNPSGLLHLDGVGNVGVGTASPVTRLTIAGAGIYNDPAAAAITLENTTAGRRWEWHALDDGSLQLADFSLAATRLLVDTAGNVGIGTTTPGERLTIGSVFSHNSGLKITGVGVSGVGMAIENLISGGHKWDLVSGDVFNPLVPSAAGNFRIVDETANATRLVIAPDGNVGIGNLINPQAKLDVQGRIRTTVLTITGGADIAEPFTISCSNIAQGSVVIIDEENPGQLKLSSQPYDTRVAGIVSGANGIHPGISLQQEGALEGGQNIALSGRVYVLADAANGAIKPGDLLTSSGTSGHAMKAVDHARAQGAILGKAMTGLKEGKGMVLALVTLQ